ncbi:hypothetical protein AAWM_08707 [Aspergillus awamori]|uniref:Uncharacterized protein n=1 Tax=Aspergillus awamori TaxID=105351 RepID=A0A401L2U5_ASPAW|nr:hypothetical protein AAWM_08707 [Aspergillus awamori]
MHWFITAVQECKAAAQEHLRFPRSLPCMGFGNIDSEGDLTSMRPVFSPSSIITPPANSNFNRASSPPDIILGVRSILDVLVNGHRVFPPVSHYYRGDLELCAVPRDHLAARPPGNVERGARKTAQQWADAHEMQTLTTAMGPPSKEGIRLQENAGR